VDLRQNISSFHRADKVFGLFALGLFFHDEWQSLEAHDGLTHSGSEKWYDTELRYHADDVTSATQP
jgi:hypothetical protein